MQKKKIPFDGRWIFKVDSLHRGITEEWYSVHYNKKTWSSVDVPGYWERYHCRTPYNGFGWYACTIEVKDISQHLSLFFGGVDDDARVWLNGIQIGAHNGYSESFAMPLEQVVKSGINEIVVRVNGHGGLGGIYNPIKIIPTNEVDQLLHTKYSSMEAKRSPNWVKNAIIYEVYLRSYSHEGTLKALESRIPELKKLGVTVVWLMPIHPIGKVNRKGTLGSPYSVQDYYAINPEYGTLDDFKSLVKTVHQQGMKIIIDLVANHTAWDNLMLKEHPEWYTRDKDGKIIPPNPDWTDVADLNYDQAELRSYMITMMKYWVHDIGIDGYRCDVAEFVPTNFWEAAVKELESIKPVMMVSEGALPEHHVKAFDLTYSWNVYDVLTKVIQGSTPATIFHELFRIAAYQYPKDSQKMRFNTNHDKNAWDAPAVIKFTSQGAKVTAVLTFTYPGVPLIYNGEEVGNEKKLDLFEKVDIDWSKNVDFRIFYEQLASIRKEHPAFTGMSYVAVKNSNESRVLTFLRLEGSDTVLIAINFDHKSVDIRLSSPMLSSGKWKSAFSDLCIDSVNNECSLNLPALGCAVLSRVSQ
jgi:cyclomaltodextrinase